MADGISRDGENAESRFRDLAGASKPARAADGDAVIDGYFFEVKKASKTTINQVRAVKYITLVVFHPPSDSWYVVPPQDVVRFTVLKARGQHTENPFESATLSLTKIRDFKVDNQELLRQSALRAARSGSQYPELHEEMANILRQSSLLARASVERVKAALAKYELDGEQPLFFD